VQGLAAEDEDNEASEHADAGEAEAIAPADRLAEIADQDGADRRAEVNPHVEDGVGAVAPGVGELVELAHHHRDVGLEEAGADDDEGERRPEDVDRRVGLSAGSFHGHQEVAAHQQYAAEQHRASLAEIAVGEIAAEHGRDVNQAGIGAVDQVRFVVGEQPVLGEVEDQKGAHAVVGEALPHLGEEEHVEALRVAERLGLAARGDHAAPDQEEDEYAERDRGNPVALGPQAHVFETGHDSPSHRLCAAVPPLFVGGH
jgi:hypothetical protein